VRANRAQGGFLIGQLIWKVSFFPDSDKDNVNRARAVQAFFYFWFIP
jgi:hypothetical protein